MKRVNKLLDKKFLTEEEVIELEENESIDYEFCGMSGLYPGYKWEVITVNGEEYNIYYK